MDSNIIFSIITTITAIIALFQTKRQITLSNKQHLFDVRLKNYLIFKKLIYSYEHNRTLFPSTDDMWKYDLVFKEILNNTYSEKTLDIITDPLNYDFRVKFLYKLEDITELSNNLKYIFSGKAALYISTFISQYRNLLFALYEYHIIFFKYVKGYYNIPYRQATPQIISQDETKLRTNIHSAHNAIEETYSKIIKENMQSKIEKQIKFKRFLSP